MEAFKGMPRQVVQQTHGARNFFIVIVILAVITGGVFIATYKNQLFISSSVPGNVSGNKPTSGLEPIMPTDKARLLQAAATSTQAERGSIPIDHAKVLQNAKSEAAVTAPPAMTNAEKAKLLESAR